MPRFHVHSNDRDSMKPYTLSKRAMVAKNKLLLQTYIYIYILLPKHVI
jgi:hypothetical protein